MHFFKKNKNKIIVASVAIILIIVMGLTSTGRKSASKVEDFISTGFGKVGGFFYSLGDKSSNTISFIKNLSSLKDENKKLSEENASLKEENRHYKTIVSQKDYLKLEYDLLNNEKYELLSANITGKEQGNWFDRFTIDKGLNHGVKNGDTIIRAVEGRDGLVKEGVVGRVVEVGNTSSKVVSLIDENSKVSFKTDRTQDGGMLSGNSDGKITGYFFDAKADVKKGDEVFTSGLGGIYSKDLLIGKVTKIVKKDEALMKTIEVEPSINFKKLYRVFVISSEGRR